MQGVAASANNQSINIIIQTDPEDPEDNTHFDILSANFLNCWGVARYHLQVHDNEAKKQDDNLCSI